MEARRSALPCILPAALRASLVLSAALASCAARYVKAAPAWPQVDPFFVPTTEEDREEFGEEGQGVGKWYWACMWGCVVGGRAVGWWTCGGGSCV